MCLACSVQEEVQEGSRAPQSPREEATRGMDPAGGGAAQGGVGPWGGLLGRYAHPGTRSTLLCTSTMESSSGAGRRRPRSVDRTLAFCSSVSG